MSKGKRYSGEQKLNYKKVVAVVIAIVVLILCVIMIKSLITKAQNPNKQSKVVNYFALYENNLWGIIDSNGKKVIEPMYQEMIIVVNKEKDVFLCTYDIDEENGTYKTKAIDSKNEMLFTKYSKIEAIENMDKSGNLWYENNVLRVKQNDKYGLINLDGNELIAPIYDEIYSLKGVKESLIVKQDGLYGLLNNKGNLIISPKYKEIKSLDDKDYQKGYITIDENDKYGLLDVTGKTILENKYEKIEGIYSDNYYVIEESGKQKLINKSGEEINLTDYDKITQIINSGIVYSKDNKYGVVNFEGETVVKPIYDYLEEINTDVIKSTLNDKCGLIDLNEDIKLTYEFTDIYYNKDAKIYIAENTDYTSSIYDSNFELKAIGVISELNKDMQYIKLKNNDTYKYYNFDMEEKDVKDILTSNTLYVNKNNGKYGFVNKRGDIVIDYIYDDATQQNVYGFAAIKKDGLWGAIDSNGNIIIEPKYNLDNNLVVDFIGKWHLGEDLNMNYYCEK